MFEIVLDRPCPVVRCGEVSAEAAWVTSRVLTQIDNFHLRPFLSITLTLKSTPMVAVRLVTCRVSVCDTRVHAVAPTYH